MGIQGLLPFLKNALSPGHIRDYRGCTVAIDTYCWLHKGAFACAEKLAAGEKTDMYVYYCMKYVNMLLSHDIKPILVFDGCNLPSKRDVEKKRRERREMNRKKAAQLLREGKRKEARDALVQCIDITPQMALELMNACREKGVDCITAPYEADAQLAYLSQTGIAQVIITEDSDLILFGCDTIMFKMDTSGCGMVMKKKDLNKAMGLQDAHYTFEKFRYMCMLSGCDYLPSLPGVGLSKACKALKMTRQTEIKMILKKLPTLMNSRNLTVTSEYIEGFVRADNTFRYQLIFDPRTRQLLPLNPYPPGCKASDFEYAGPPMSPERALQLALGNMDIHGNKIADFDPALHKPRSQSWTEKCDTKERPYLLSIWDPDYQRRNDSDVDNCAEDSSRPSTKGKEVLLQAMGISGKKRKSDEVDKPDVLKDKVATPNSIEKPKRFSKGSEDPLCKKPRLSAEKCSPVKRKSEVEETFIYIGKNDQNDLPSTEDQEVHSHQKHASRNIFAATKSPPNKSKFSLDATKSPQTEVTSRFFTASSKPLRKTSFFSALKENHEESDVEETENETIDSPEAKIEVVCWDESLRDLNQTHEKSNSTAKSAKSPAYPSCGLSSKLSRFKSKFEFKNSPGVSTPFKPVGSPASQKSLCRTLSGNSIDASQPNSLVSSQGSIDQSGTTEENQESETSLCSQQTQLYSMDMDCWDLESLKSNSQTPDSPLLPQPPSDDWHTESPTKTPSPQSSQKSITSMLSSQSKRSDIYMTPSPKMSNKEISSEDSVTRTPSNIKTTPLAGVKSGCRFSGLAKSKAGQNQKSKASKAKSSSQENQMSIQNFFTSKFAFQKNSEKVPAAKPLSPNSSHNKTSSIEDNAVCLE